VVQALVQPGDVVLVDLSYDDSFCEYLSPDEVQQRIGNGEQVVSTTFVTPYPPGFLVLVPGQLFSECPGPLRAGATSGDVARLRPWADAAGRDPDYCR
jgi:arginine/lysine/ornithine decarboxylase